jgi:hypothetical protein
MVPEVLGLVKEVIRARSRGKCRKKRGFGRYSKEAATLLADK